MRLRRATTETRRTKALEVSASQELDPSQDPPTGETTGENGAKGETEGGNAAAVPNEVEEPPARVEQPEPAA